MAQGPDSFGHEVVVADWEAITLRAGRLAGACHWGMDHTDIFRRRGLLRSMVRQAREERAARLPGPEDEARELARVYGIAMS
jgi:hypothetical protein